MKELQKLADDFVNKIPKGNLHGNSKTVIGFELTMFLKFIKKESNK